MQRLMILLILSGCGVKAAPDPLIFHNEVINYGFTRYENDEVICYTKGEALSCVRK